MIMDKRLPNAGGKTGAYLGNLAATLQVLPAKTLEKNRDLLNKLKLNKNEILKAYIMYIAYVHAHVDTKQEKAAVIAELDRTLRGNNAVGRLCKTKLRLKEFKIDNIAMKQLKDLRDNLVKGTEMKVELSQGPRYR